MNTNNSTAPTGRYSLQTFDSSDPWNHSKNIDSWESHYEQLMPTAFRGRYTEAWLGGVQIFHEDVNSSYSWRGHAWKGARVFFSCFPQTGPLYFDNRQVEAPSFTTHRWDAAERTVCNGGYKGIYVIVDEEQFQHYAEQLMCKRFFDHNQGGIVSSSDPETGRYFRNSVLQLLEELQTTPTSLTHKADNSALENRVLALLFDTMEKASDSVAPLPPPATRAYIVDKAMEYIESRLADSITTTEICKTIRVSPRTLRYSFEEILSMSPMRYVLSRRLIHVRRELLNCSQPALIEMIAVRWGFWHMGRFAQYYRQFFGERPSDTLKRAQKTLT